MIEFICNSLENTQKAAKYLSQFAEVGRCFSLFGDLGYGKTTLAKYLIKSLNPSIQDVTSPTFTIVQTYHSVIAEIWHIDCYRLKSTSEFYELGLDEALGNCIMIIEWPEIIEELLPLNSIKINFLVENKTRKLQIHFPDIMPSSSIK
ncbi:MAG: tRNA (adenosine(37)-N6)-threonylcarbamoyltransferase complex ATPase subunit type 1 TsaE [Holosporaceae bacterium]|jgi:tRNA threonylcarbamoyladenosine biosynthesis protein TsaE|nr:tRNA (adenosine(37)-N6)-threonylcarbamoyltransferase complex ATPase subunit type 1 TsaE [Holosporaceae bacterium]